MNLGTERWKNCWRPNKKWSLPLSEPGWNDQGETATRTTSRHLINMVLFHAISFIENTFSSPEWIYQCKNINNADKPINQPRRGIFR